jgi:hypothetical protein
MKDIFMLLKENKRNTELYFNKTLFYWLHVKLEKILSQADLVKNIVELKTVYPS